MDEEPFQWSLGGIEAKLVSPEEWLGSEHRCSECEQS